MRSNSVRSFKINHGVPTVGEMRDEIDEYTQVLLGHEEARQYRFRTGELRTFCEMAAKAIELGSRRVTVAQLEADLSRG